MMYPDCRNDDYYNEDFLTETDKAEINGYDWCAEEVINNFFDNMDIYFEDDSYLMHTLNQKLPEDMQYDEEIEWTFGDRENTVRKIETYKDLLRSKLLDYIEMDRDDIITSMIENMDEDLYNAIRNKVLKDNEKKEKPKEYYNTRKYAVTGRKEMGGPEADETND